MQTENIFVVCYRCRNCGNATIQEKKVCPECGKLDIERVESNGKGHLLDYTNIYFAPDNFQNIAPYTSVLVQLNNNCKVFGIIRGECEDLVPGTPVNLAGYDEVNGTYFFRLTRDNE